MAALVPKAEAAISVDNSGGAFISSNATNLTVSSFAVGAGADRVLIVGVAMKELSRFSTSSVTFGGTSLTLIGGRSHSGGSERVEMYYLLAPASTTADIVLTGTGSGCHLAMGAVSLAGVLQSAPVGFVSAQGASATPSITLNGIGADDMVVDVVAWADLSADPSVGTGQSERWLERGADITSLGSTEPAGGNSTVTMSWNGQSVDWAMGAVRLQPAASSPLSLIKKVFLPDGTPVPDTMTVPAGQPIRYLIYINNSGSARTDVSVQDVLNAAIEYQPGTIRIDNSVPNCAADTCTAGEESAIFSAVNVAGVSTDAVDGDAARFNAGSATIDIGDQNAANAPLDIAADKVWAAMFSAEVR